MKKTTIFPFFQKAFLSMLGRQFLHMWIFSEGIFCKFKFETVDSAHFYQTGFRRRHFETFNRKLVSSHPDSCLFTKVFRLGNTLNSQHITLCLEENINLKHFVTCLVCPDRDRLMSAACTDCPSAHARMRHCKPAALA